MKKPAIKTIPYRCRAEKHEAVMAMLRQRGLGWQKFMDEVATAAISEWQAEKRFLALRKQALPPDKAVALLRRIQNRVKPSD